MRFFEEMIPMRDGALLYTLVALPDEAGRYPILFSRSPYDGRHADPRDSRPSLQPFIDAGWAWVHQSCRGTARSEGVFVPFENERYDGLDTLNWLRCQPFYNGEIYVQGASYCSYVHLSYLADKPADVKGAMLWVMPSHMRRGMVVNDVFKQDVIMPWYAKQYHKNQAKTDSFATDYPGITLQRPLGKALNRYYEGGCPEFEALMVNKEDAPCWSGENGAGDALNALKELDIPILLMEGWYDIYIGEADRMWRELPASTRAKSALLIGPWPHSCMVDERWDIDLPNGERPPRLMLNWFEHLRGRESLQFVREGKVTSYTIGAGLWRQSPDVPQGDAPETLYFGQDGCLDEALQPAGKRVWSHDPNHPVGYIGGANAFGTVPSGVYAQPDPDFADGVISFLTEPFNCDRTVSGRALFELRVQSDCEASAVFARLMVERGGQYLPMQESIAAFEADGEGKALVRLETDPMCWRIFKGERLRVDIASANWPTYPSHGNVRGDIAIQTATRVARNALITGASKVHLPFEKD